MCIPRHNFAKGWSGTDQEGAALEAAAIQEARDNAAPLFLKLNSRGRRQLHDLVEAAQRGDAREASILVHLVHAHLRANGHDRGLGLYPVEGGSHLAQGA